MKIRTGDTVVIISGKDKGKTGSVTRVLRKESRVVVAGINMRTRHIKKTFQEAGRKLKYEASIDISKVMIVDPTKQKPSRVGFKIENGKKLRVSKLSGETVMKAKAVPKKTMKKGAEGTKATEETEGKTKKTSVSSETPDTSKKQQPFWKRMKFGASALEQAETSEPSHMSQDHSIPGQQVPMRKGSRGS